VPMRLHGGEFPGVKNCPGCGRPPIATDIPEMGGVEFKCCSSGWLDAIEWNLYADRCTVFSEPTPEEDEEFERLEASQNPEPEWPLAEIGRHIERFGKLLQDPESTIADLAGAAHDAGFNLRFDIQPTVE